MTRDQIRFRVRWGRDSVTRSTKKRLLGYFTKDEIEKIESMLNSPRLVWMAYRSLHRRGNISALYLVRESDQLDLPSLEDLEMETETVKASAED